jgi:hypothetical protein
MGDVMKTVAISSKHAAVSIRRLLSQTVQGDKTPIDGDRENISDSYWIRI